MPAEPIDEDDPETGDEDGPETSDGDEPATGDGDGPEASDTEGSKAADLIVAERRTQEGLLVSVCDDDALGETYEDGEVSLTVTEEFYGGDPATEAETLDSLSRAAVANVVGVRAVELSIEAGYVEEANVLEVDGTRHAQFMRL